MSLIGQTILIPTWFWHFCSGKSPFAEAPMEPIWSWARPLKGLLLLGISPPEGLGWLVSSKSYSNPQLNP